jgi:transposase
LYRELQAQGYHGSSRAVNRVLSSYVGGQVRDRHIPHRSRQPAQSHWLVPLSAWQASWVLWRDPEQESEAQRNEHEALLSSDPEIRKADRLVHDWQRMLKGRVADELSSWLEQAGDAAIAELVRFAAGIRHDQAAVQAGICLPYSNGLLEGQINRLKTIKRSMYGRACFELLRQRVLLSSA